MGWLFIIGGILGLFLPFLQGFLFLFVGLGLLSRSYPLLRKIRCSLERKFGITYSSILNESPPNSSALAELVKEFKTGCSDPAPSDSQADSTQDSSNDGP